MCCQISEYSDHSEYSDYSEYSDHSDLSEYSDHSLHPPPVQLHQLDAFLAMEDKV